MKRRWRLLLGVGGIAATTILLPIAAIETGCRAAATPPAPVASVVPSALRRPEARTWLTYPEWHIVYSAESLGRHLAAGRPPSAYDYGADVAGFWRSYCAINRIAAERPGTGEAKLMIYTIGISFTAEMAIKAAWENIVGRISETLGGWASPEDRYAARIQQRYAGFMHEIPWYRFGFGEALGGLWATQGDWSLVRRPERRVALSAEYGVKAIYAKALGAATGASLAPDALTLRMVVRARAATLRTIDPRLKPLRQLPGGATLVEAPRYAQFTDLITKLGARGIAIDDIAGNHTIFLTIRAPEALRPPAATLAMPLGDRPGWWRYGVTLPVGNLTRWIATARARGAQLEHVYDY
ncbi:hypothetical protein [Sphingomonas radiodurans]|uniref:hypothetical protein n=1 Tax=Sphingomonas radiodurans TaxID=2890321 RepID=UPI001E2960C3|nr:hypothetical protein [Sphingomonas radiodurans]WBH15027.1 hypothetical protein LLW23_09095 [Sphingomonas radiodurans]